MENRSIFVHESGYEREDDDNSRMKFLEWTDAGLKFIGGRSLKRFVARDILIILGQL